MLDPGLSWLVVVVFWFLCVAFLMPSLLLWQYFTWRRLGVCNAQFRAGDNSIKRHIQWLLTAKNQREQLILSIALLIGQMLFYGLIMMIYRNSFKDALPSMVVALPVSTLIPIAIIWNTQMPRKQKGKVKDGQETKRFFKYVLFIAPVFALACIIGLFICSALIYKGRIYDTYPILQISMNLIYFGGLVEYILAPFLAMFGQKLSNLFMSFGNEDDGESANN